jgi:hypothetical protein
MFYNTRTPFKHWNRYIPTSSQARVLVVQASVAAYLQDLLSKSFSYGSLNARKQKKILPTSYLRGQKFNVSSTKRRACLSRNWLSQRHCYYKVCIRLASWSLSQRDLSPKSVSAPNYLSHCLSPMYLQRMRYKRRLLNWETSKSRPPSRKTPPSHNSTTGKKVPPAHAQQVYSFLRNSVCGWVRAKRGKRSKRVLIRKISNFSFSMHWRNTTVIHYFLLAQKDLDIFEKWSWL